MSNNHFKQTLDGLDAMHDCREVSEAMSLAAIQAQATLALAYEQRTANLIAALQPVRLLGGKEWLPEEAAVLRVRADIDARLYGKVPE